MVVVAVSGILYLTTLQRDINGADSPYTPDVGEIVNALNLWGTLHQAGYPLFSISGSAFVALIRLFGIGPATAATLWSWLWGVVTVGLTYMLALPRPGEDASPRLGRLAGRWEIAASVATLYAVSRSLWVDSSIAELHTFSMALAALLLLLGLRAADNPTPRSFHWLAIVFGVAVSHQRALVLLAPALLVLLAQPYLRLVRKRPLLVLMHAGLFLLPWLTYAYLPLRVRMGAIWTFGKPGTWETLRPFITADETRTNISLANSFADWLARSRLHLQTLNAELLPGIVPLGLLSASLIPLFLRRRKEALFFAAAWIPFVLAAYVAYVGFVWDAYLAVLMPATLIAILGLSMAGAALVQQCLWLGRALAGILVGAAIVTAGRGYAFVSDIQAAQRGRQVIDTFARAVEEGAAEPTVFSATWGLDYFALAYGALVSNEISGVSVVDQTAHFGELEAAGNRIIVLPRSFYLFGLAFWDGQLGQAYLSSAGPGLVRVAATPVISEEDLPEVDAISMGDSFALVAYAYELLADKNALHVTLYWQSERAPAEDYSVFVHLSDQAAISAPEHILAQSDSSAPVYGFYPTTRWSAGEIVREDYVVDLPDERLPVLLRTGLYTRTSDGGFENLGEANIPLDLAK